MNLLKLKAAVSSSLAVLLIPVAFTGIGLYFAPSGRIARETSWAFFGLSKLQLEQLHTITGFIFAGLAVIHFILNLKMLLCELKQFKAKK